MSGCVISSKMLLVYVMEVGSSDFILKNLLAIVVLAFFKNNECLFLTDLNHFLMLISLFH